MSLQRNAPALAGGAHQSFLYEVEFPGGHVGVVRIRGGGGIALYGRGQRPAGRQLFHHVHSALFTLRLGGGICVALGGIKPERRLY